MSICVIGDSHVSMFRGDGLISPTSNDWFPSPLCEEIKICHLGPVTIGSLAGNEPPPGRPNYLRHLEKNLDQVTEMDSLVLSVGEIDLRCRVLKGLGVKIGGDAQDAKRQITQRLQGLADVMELSVFPILRKKLGYGSWFYLLPFAAPLEYSDEEGNDYKPAGTAQDRRAATDEFRALMLRWCWRSQSQFIDLSEVITRQGAEAFLPDQIHLAGTVPMDYVAGHIFIKMYKNQEGFLGDSGDLDL